MAQVKFYSVSALPSTASTTGAGGIYFVTGGELYKGASRFGANKVWTVPASTQISGATEEAKLSAALQAAGVSGQISGDILTGYGAAKVFNGTSWIDLGQDQAALDEQLTELVSGLAFSGTGSYITGITQGADGKVTASTSNFANDVKTAIGDGAASSTANGITVSVTTTSGSVTGVQVDASQITCESITASSATFTDLVVTSTATFSATTISATTLTVDGVAVSNISATSASDNDAGIAVTVSTANGGVTDVGVAVTASTLLASLSLTDFSGKDVVTAIGGTTGSNAATNDQIPTALAVANKFATLDNAMHFREVVASTGAVSDPAKGDIVVIGSQPTTGFVAGQEYIYDGTNWELIGDQNTYAVNAYTSTASVYSGVTNVPGALNAVGAAVDTFQETLDATVTSAADVSAVGEASNLVTAGAVAGYVAQEILDLGLGTAASQNYADSLTSTGTSLPTEAAVAGYVADVIDALAGSASDTDKGVFVEVVTADGQVSTVDVSVTAASQMAFGASGSTTELATTAAVKDFYNNNLVWLDANGSAIS